jgi:hypothetical protein
VQWVNDLKPSSQSSISTAGRPAAFLQYLLFTALLIWLTGCAPNSYLNHGIEGGFHGVRWGENYQHIDDMHLTGETGKDKVGFRKNETLKMGDVDLDKVEYFFFDDLFYEARVYFKGKAGFDRINQDIIRKYGIPWHSDAARNIYMWHYSDIDILLRYYRMQENGHLVFTFKPLMPKFRYQGDD